MPVKFSIKFLRNYKSKFLKFLKRKKTLLPFLIGFLVISIPVAYLVHRNLTKVQAAWLTGGWNYRKLIEISNASGGDLTDYQTEISVDTASLIDAGKMNADCSDIRFTSTDNSMHSYWLDKDCDTTDTRFWVKIPSIPSTGTAIYMYYSNTTAVSASSGTDTFIFFDNFDDNDYSANWETHDRSYTSTANSIATEETGGQQKLSGTTVSGTDRGNGLRTGDTFPTPIVFEADRVSYSGTGQRSLGFIHMYTDDNNCVSYGGGIGYNGNAGRHARISYINGSRGTTESISSTDDYGNHRFGIKHDGTNAVFFVDGTQMATLAASQLTSVKVGTSSWLRSLTDTIDVRFDNARVRQYASTEPTTSFKEEETSEQAPVAQWRFDEGYSADELQPQTKLEQQITILDREYGCKGCTDLPTDNSLGISSPESHISEYSTMYTIFCEKTSKLADRSI